MTGHRSAQELLPWLIPLSDRIVACKDSGLLACFEFDGLDTDGAPSGMVDQLYNVLDTAMGALRGQPITLWWTLRRERTTDYPGAEMPDAVSQMIDDEHRAKFLRDGGFVNRYFVSLLWMPKRSADTVMDRIGAYMADGANVAVATVKGMRSLTSTRESFAWRGAELEQALQSFEGRLAQFTGTLGMLGMRRLTGDDLIGFLWSVANPGLPSARKEWEADRFLDGRLPERPLQVHRDCLAFAPDTADATYLTAISLKELPKKYAANPFAPLLTAPIEAVLSVAFRVSDTATTMAEITRAKRAANLTKFPLKAVIAGAFRKGQMDEEQADPSKQEEINEAIEAVGEVSSGRRFFGWTNMTLLYYSQDYAQLENATRDALRALHAGRFAGAVRETINLLSAYTVTLPGAWEECKRWYFLSDANVTDVAPVVSVVSGERWNEHFTEQSGKLQPALTVLNTDYHTPYYFNFHVNDVGHGFVLGPNGSGKSIGMNFFMSQYRKYQPSRIVIFDRDMSCRIPTLLQGGKHIDARPGGGVKLNPFVLLDDPAHWPFLAGWLEYLLSSRGYQVTAEDAKQVWEAMEGTAKDPDPENRRLMGISNLLPGRLRAELEPWTEGQQYGEYFDHVEDSFSLTDFVCIEMGPLMNQPRVAVALMDYAFYRIELALRPKAGEPIRPTLLYVEESSFMLKVPQFANRLVGWLKTFRKLNAHLVLTTQSPEDLTETDAQKTFAAIRDNIMTRIFLPNPSAESEGLKDLYVRTFQLLPEQVRRIARAIPKRQYFIVKPGVARMVSLDLTPAQVNALRSDAVAQRVFDACWQGGKAPDGWQQRYLDQMAALTERRGKAA